MFAAPVATDPQPLLNAAEVRWSEGGLENYRFHVRRSCFCPPVYTRDYRVDVVDGQAYDAAKWIKDVDTVPKLFARIQEGIDGDGTIEVTYADSGLPTSISADPVPMAVDDEYGITAGRLRKATGQTPRPVDDTIEDGTAAQALADARATWKKNGFTRYRYHLRTRAQISDSGRFTVTDGREPLLFREIARSIRRRDSELSVRYGTSGFPRFVAADRDSRLSDDEAEYTATRLRALK